jgi:hypothetical protein
MFRFTIRDVLWLTVVVALAVGWLVDHRRLKVFEQRFHTIVAELVSRNLDVEIGADGLWIRNP